MPNLKLYIASSLDGYIAEKNGSVSWLDKFPPPSETEDYGYSEFQNTIGTTIQGYNTYKQLLDWGIDWPYKQGKHYVITRNSKRKDNKDVKFIASNPVDFIQSLKDQQGKDIWLIGGGQVNSLCLNANLIDEIWLFVMPILLLEGIKLFEGDPDPTQLKLKQKIVYDTGVIQLRYSINNHKKS